MSDQGRSYEIVNPAEREPRPTLDLDKVRQLRSQFAIPEKFALEHRLIDCFRDHLILLLAKDSGPPPRDKVVARLEKISSRANELRSELLDLTGDERRRLTFRRTDEMRDMLTRLGILARDAVKRLPRTKRGPKIKAEERELALALVDLFFSATGTMPSYTTDTQTDKLKGKVPDFIRGACGAVDFPKIPIPSDDIIKFAIKDKKKI